LNRTVSICTYSTNSTNEIIVPKLQWWDLYWSQEICSSIITEIKKEICQKLVHWHRLKQLGVLGNIEIIWQQLVKNGDTTWLVFDTIIIKQCYRSRIMFTLQDNNLIKCSFKWNIMGKLQVLKLSVHVLASVL
jgi:hypothetical protein